jgi:hypothetical protein
MSDQAMTGGQAQLLRVQCSRRAHERDARPLRGAAPQRARRRTSASKPQHTGTCLLQHSLGRAALDVNIG